MVHPEDVQHFFQVVSKTLLPPIGGGPAGDYFIALSQAGGQFAVCRIDGVADVPEHSHDYDEFCILLQGNLTAWIGGEKHVLKPGDFLYEPAHIPHVAHIEGPYLAIDFFGGPRFKAKK